LNTDDLHGDAGDDTLENSDGADSFDGGLHISAGDTVTYEPTSAAATTIDIDNVADDGRNCPGGTCEGDDVQTTVENVTGDTSNDKITGSSAANVLNGGSGDDTLAGGSGPGGDGGDRFIGGANGTLGDTVTYAPRTANLTVDIDGVADDAGENDEVELDIENLIGGTGGDNLTGDTDNNDLRGGPGTGNDTMSGVGGNDTMHGGDGTNTGADGADIFHGGSHTTGDTVSYATRTGGLTADLDGVAGDDPDGDTIGADVENLTGGTNQDTLTGNNLANILNGGPQNDTLAGGASAGADGADTFIGGTHVFSGDTVTYAARTGVIVADMDGIVGDDTDGDTVGADIEKLIGGSAGDTLTGNSAENTLHGGPGTGSDTLSGLGDDDEFFGGTGANTGPDGADTFIAGDQGTDGDTVSYESRLDPITADIAGGADDTDGDNILSTIDNITGGSGDDTLIGDGDPNEFRAGAGNDTMSGGTSAGADGADTFLGGTNGPAGDTVSYANRTEDVDANLDIVIDDGDATNCPGVGCEGDRIAGDVENLTGGSGDDDLEGDSLANILNGGPGDDDFTTSPFTGPDGADTYIGGTDGTVGGQNNDRDRVMYFNRLDDLTVDIGGGPDVDGDDVRDDIEVMWGGEGDDTLTGDEDPNEIDGRQGDDTVSGGAGTGPDGADALHAGTGNDTVTYAGRTDDLTIDMGTQSGPDGDLVAFSLENVFGGSGDDNITGDSLDNTLRGGGGEDDLFGLAGADTLLVRDGEPDTADCGDDIDSAVADEPIEDDLIACETADVLPNTRITDRPNDRITGRRATYEFESDEATLFQCRLDGGSFNPCTSPKTFRNLSLGRHTVRIRAVDADGDRDPTPALDRFRRVRNL
jgi:Ca2+-binding RTX toxin-like protein